VEVSTFWREPSPPFGRRVLRGRRRRESLLFTQSVLLVPLFPALPLPDPSLLLASRSLLLPRCAARALGLGAWAGRTP
jgi:hypothetical protein